MNYQQPGTGNPASNGSIGIYPNQTVNPMDPASGSIGKYVQPMSNKDDPAGTIRGFTN